VREHHEDRQCSYLLRMYAIGWELGRKDRDDETDSELILLEEPDRTVLLQFFCIQLLLFRTTPRRSRADPMCHACEAQNLGRQNCQAYAQAPSCKQLDLNTVRAGGERLPPTLRE